MKTYELANAVKSVSEHIKPNDMDALLEAVEQLKDASARPLKKSKEVYIWRVERVSRNTYRDVFEWVPCGENGEALTPTGRVMKAKHEEYAWTA